MPKTPHKGIIQSSESRDLAALKDRRQSQSDTIKEFADADTVPEFADEEGTAPISLIERGESRHERELRLIQKRYDDDPAFRALWNMMRRQRRESNRTLGKVADTATETHQEMRDLKDLSEKLDSIDAWKNRVDTSLSIAKWVLGFVLAATLGSIIVVATKIYTWGVSSGELEIRLQHLERASDRRNSSFPTNLSSPAITSPARNP